MLGFYTKRLSRAISRDLKINMHANIRKKKEKKVEKVEQRENKKWGKKSSVEKLDGKKLYLMLISHHSCVFVFSITIFLIQNSSKVTTESECIAQQQYCNVQFDERNSSSSYFNPQSKHICGDVAQH